VAAPRSSQQPASGFAARCAGGCLRAVSPTSIADDPQAFAVHAGGAALDLRDQRGATTRDSPPELRHAEPHNPGPATPASATASDCAAATEASLLASSPPGTTTQATSRVLQVKVCNIRYPGRSGGSCGALGVSCCSRSLHRPRWQVGDAGGHKRAATAAIKTRKVPDPSRPVQQRSVLHQAAPRARGSSGKERLKDLTYNPGSPDSARLSMGSMLLADAANCDLT
jgi:hypothetical protein